MEQEEMEKTTLRPSSLPFTELHIHAGAGLSTSTMWHIAHQQGIRLPFEDYWEFKDHITITKEKMMDLDAFLHSDKNPFHWCEVIQSSPMAMERTIYDIAAKAYRTSNVQKIEIRFTPMKRNHNGSKDLDHIIMGALRGLDMVMLEYPVQVGLIFCLEKNFSKELNKITVQKAIKYKHRGVVGIDLAGLDISNNFNPDEMSEVFLMAKEAGLGITVHAGEEDEALSVKDAILKLYADRIGHGVRSIHNPEELELIQKRGVVMEFCPTSNLTLGLLRSIEDVRKVVSTWEEAGVLYTLNTDDPVYFHISLHDEFNLLLDNNIINHDRAQELKMVASKASFIKK